MEILEGPLVVARPRQHTAGIRLVTPFRGMFAVRDELMDELYAWLDSRSLDYGTTFFRLHVIDMAGDMEIEVGVITPTPLDGDARVTPGDLPAGNYAILKYLRHGRRANGTLIDWTRAQNLPMDVQQSPTGDHFACRYEAYLTDPRSERMKTKWQTELAIRLT